MIIPYISKWPQALMIMSLPPNVPPALANLLTLVDDICYFAGDRSVDVSYSSLSTKLPIFIDLTDKNPQKLPLKVSVGDTGRGVLL
jgi:hypothetical protein